MKEKEKKDGVNTSKDKGTIHSKTARIADKHTSDKKSSNDYKYIQRSKEDLQQKAKHIGIKGYKFMSKEKLIEAIENS